MSEGLPVYPQLEDAPCRADRDPLDMNSLNHSYQTIKHNTFEVSLLRYFEKQIVGMPVRVFRPLRQINTSILYTLTHRLR